MLEAVVVVGVLLALAVGGFAAYGTVTENAKKAKIKSAASEVLTATRVASMDGDSATEPEEVIRTWNASNDQIRVQLLSSSADEAATSGDYCVSATSLEDPTITFTSGTCSTPISSGDPAGSVSPPAGPTIDTSNVMTTVWDTRLTTDANYNTANYATPNLQSCTTISVPLARGVDATINWGDGSPEQPVKSDYNTTSITHTYTGTAGLRTVTVTGKFEAWVGWDWINWTQGCITEVTSWGDGTGTFDGQASFNGAVNLTDVARIPSTMTDLNNFLSANSASFTGDSLHLWDTSNVIVMDGMFADMKGITGDISGWDTSNVDSMENIFAGSTFNGNISDWNVRKVVWWNGAFASSSFNGDISGWEPASAYRMSGMLQDATSFNHDLSGWNVSSVKEYAGFGQGSGLTANKLPAFQ